MTMCSDTLLETMSVHEMHNLRLRNGAIPRVQLFKVHLTPGLDYSAPIGPVLVSPKALPDPHNLEMKSIHNGNVVQTTNTKYGPTAIF
jgi:Fumarylacetoacetate (FAA) hydrolase family